MFVSNFYRAAIKPSFRATIRSVSTLQSNSHIYIFPPNSGRTTTQIPPTTDSFIENPQFLSILNDVMRKHAAEDPMVQGQAAAFASTSGSALGSGGMFFPQQSKRKSKAGGMAGDGAGGASSQGGAGGGGRGGYVHVSDLRAPPDYGRIAWPEDIFGSLEVDGQGNFVKGDDGILGNWQSSGSYRIITREGILGLSDYLRERLIARLQDEEKSEGK